MGLCSHGNVRDDRLAIPSRVQRAFLRSCKYDGDHSVLMVSDVRRERSVPKRRLHFWSRDIHCGVPFNDAYRYMDWLLTVPLLLIEILLVMKLDDKTYSSKAWTLGAGSALMIVSGYYGELVVTGDLTPRWVCWALSMCFFLYIVYELLVGLSAATNSEANPEIKAKIQTAQVMTVISWCTYPVV